MCVGQPGHRAECCAPANFVEGSDAQVLAARLVEALVSGLGRFPEGSQRAEECGKRRRVLASKLWHLQGTLKEIVALAEGGGARQPLAPLLRKAHGCCMGLRQAAEVLKAQEVAQLEAAKAGSSSKSWAQLEAALSDCAGQVRQLAAARAGAAQREARCGCLAGFFQLWARPARSVGAAKERAGKATGEEKEEQPASPGEREGHAEGLCLAFARKLAPGDGRAPRVLCGDARLAEALLACKCNGVAPAVTSVLEDPTQAQILSRVMGAAAMDAIILGSPRATMHRLAERGLVFDAVVFEEPVLSELPSGLLAPGGCAVPRSALPQDFDKLRAA